MIDWSINGAEQGFQNALSLGAKIGDAIVKHREQSALAHYAANPNMETASALLPMKPELALKLQEHERQKSFGEAAARYMGRGGALSGVGAGQTPGFGDGIPGNRRIDGSTVPLGGPEMARPVGPHGGQPPQQNPDFKILGNANSDADAAFLEMLRQDPNLNYSPRWG